MRYFPILAAFFFASFFLGSCTEQDSSAQNSSGELEENEVVVSVDGDEWSTTNVRLAGSDVFGLSASSTGTLGITVDLGYGLAETGTITNDCEYSSEGEGISNEWVDEECSIEITTFTDDEIQGSFSFTGVSEDGSEKSVSGRFRVEKMGVRWD